MLKKKFFKQIPANIEYVLEGSRKIRRLLQYIDSETVSYF